MILPSDYGPEDYLAWTHNPITKAFFQALEDDRRMLMECWAQKKFIGENADQTNFLNAEALAKVSAIDEILLGVQESVEEARRAVEGKN